MASPRVFISSTFYDLRQVREDIERFVKDLGYEPVRNETGSIPYGKEEPPEAYAYREIELCDIVVSIIGGRFGTDSQQEKPYSISQKELRTALKRGVQVFIFIDRNVYAEYSTYLLNKGNNQIKYRFADDVRVYQFIEEINALPRNNPIAPFDTSADILDYLKLQWAGLFQRFLQEQKRISEMGIIEELNATAGTLKQLVDFLTNERRDKDEAIKSILFTNHPAFRRFAEVTSTAYRVFFLNKLELSKWLRARLFTPIDPIHWDDPLIEEWKNDKQELILKFRTSIFDEANKLKNITEDEWDDSWIFTEVITPSFDIEDEEIPF